MRFILPDAQHAPELDLSVRMEAGVLRRIAWLAALCAASLAPCLVSPSAAGDPPGELFDTVDCYCTGTASSLLPLHCTISPDGGSPGDLVHVDVVVHNILGNPLQDVRVTMTPVALFGASATWCPGEAPQVKLSAADGSADFVFDNGSLQFDAWPGTEPETIDFDGTRQGPGPGGPSALPDCRDPLRVLSFDLMEADLTVDIVDFALFSADLGTNTLRSDFDHSGAVGIVDFAMFSAHLNRGCP